MKKRSIALLLTAAAAGVYSAAAGKGLFNKTRFKDQHDAISRYVSSHYGNAIYTPIEQTANGWATTIIRPGMPKIFLYTFKTEDGSYVFSEVNAS